MGNIENCIEKCGEFYRETSTIPEKNGEFYKEIYRVFQFRGRFQDFFSGGGLVGSSATGALGLDV